MRPGTGPGVLLAGLLLAGCTTTIPVRVAVPVPCNPPEVQAPVKPINAIPAEATIFEKVRAMWATIEVLEGYSAELQASIDVCRSQP